MTEQKPLSDKQKLEEIREIAEHWDDWTHNKNDNIKVLSILDAPSAEPKGEVVLVRRYPLQDTDGYYSYCDKRTPKEEFEQWHNVRLEEDELIEALMTLTTIKDKEQK